MPEFAIVTPTIGRDTLTRCLITMRHQIVKDYLQIVIGDGPQEPHVKEQCLKEERVHYIETQVKENFYGTTPRNMALETIESGKLGKFNYILFLDDDNILLESALYNILNTAIDNNKPPLIWHDILFTNKFETKYSIMPKGGVPLMERDFDGLNCIFRSDIIHGLRFGKSYDHDFQFAKLASERANGQWVKCNDIGGVHCLSWDTYDQQP